MCRLGRAEQQARQIGEQSKEERVCFLKKTIVCKRAPTLVGGVEALDLERLADGGQGEDGGQECQGGRARHLVVCGKWREVDWLAARLLAVTGPENQLDFPRYRPVPSY